MKTIKEWCAIVHANWVKKGFRDPVPTEWQLIGGLMSEAAEAWQELRQPNYQPKRTYYRHDGKPEGLPSELADVVLTAFIVAEELGIDLEKAIQEKHDYNTTRAFRHGGKRS